MYSNTSAVIRPDLQFVIEQAMHADKKFIGSKILPPKFSPRRNGEYHFVDLATGGLLESELGNGTLRAPKSSYREVDRTFSKKSYNCLDRGLKEVVDDGDAAEVAPSFDAEALSTKLCIRNMNISQEHRIASTMFDESTFSANNPTVNYTAANKDTIDVPADIEALIDKVSARGEIVNTIVIPHQLWTIIRGSKLLGQYIFGNLYAGQKITVKAFAEIFATNNPLNVHIAEGTYSAAGKGKSVTDAKIKYIWPNTHIWAGNCSDGVDIAAPTPETPDSNPAIISEGVGRTIIWEEQAGSLFVPETYRDEDRRSDIIRVRQFSCEHIFNPNCGQLLRATGA